MRTWVLGILTMIVSGCAVEAPPDSVLARALADPVTAHAAALAGEDVPAMRRTGRVVIATYDAAVGGR